jgi:hypothetical protein
MVQARTAQAPQLGFNNNVKHNGRVFHIQTEDSGVHHPHITTHLFADGGRILRTERTDYRELLTAPDLVAQLRQRMKEQHRAMFTALRQGQLDHLIDAGSLKPSGAQSVTPAVQRASRTSPPKAGTTPPPGRTAARTSVSDRTPPPARATPTTARAAVRSAPPRNSTTQARPSSRPKAGSKPNNARPDRPTPTRPSTAGSEKSSHTSSGGHKAVRPSLPGGNEVSLFGQAKVSEQSLDDIILSYISEDLEGD